MLIYHQNAEEIIVYPVYVEIKSEQTCSLQQRKRGRGGKKLFMPSLASAKSLRLEISNIHGLYICMYVYICMISYTETEYTHEIKFVGANESARGSSAHSLLTVKNAQL